MLGTSHPHGERVIALLDAARQAMVNGAWACDPTTSLGLALVLVTPAQPPSDATNYLGGVGDVLEDKSRRGLLPHLGELGAVHLYPNDRMIHEVAYRWDVGSTTAYSVRLWTR